MAIAMAQIGGLGVIHRNLSPKAQADQVRQVKRFESGMVANPITIFPDETLADAFALMKQHGISGVPVVERGAEQKGKLVGILTNRDVRFATNPRQPVAELMTKDRLITVREGVEENEAKRLLHQFRIEKLLVVDEHYRCIGLITVKDIEKQVAYPNAAKDAAGRLLVAAATTTGRRVSSAPRCSSTPASMSSSSTPPMAIRRACSRGRAGEEIVKFGASHRRQCRDGRGDEGADRCRRRRGEDRHRPRLDMHDAHGGGRRRATAFRDLDCAEAARIRRAGDRRWRHQVLRRSREGPRGRRFLRHGGLAACRNG